MALARAITVDINVVTRARVVDLYRRMCRSAPSVTINYQLSSTPADLRRAVMLEFRKHATVTDPLVVDIMLSKAEMEFQETVNIWKQRGHLLALLNPDAQPADSMLDPEEFFKRFLDGTLSSKEVWKDWSRLEQAKVLRAVAADPETGERVSAEDLQKWGKKWGKLPARVM